jgi:hypothetical protein
VGNHVPDLNEVNMEYNMDDNEEHMVILGLPAVFQQPNFSHEVDEADLIDLNAMAEGVEQANILHVEVNLYNAKNIEIQLADEPMQQIPYQNNVQVEFHNNINGGMVEIFPSTEINTVFEVYSQAQALIPWAPKQKVDGVGLWAKHFAPMNSQNSSKIPVE